MKYRIAMWASAGFLVAGSWALYFARASKDNPIEPIVYTLARLTQPVAAVSDYFNFPLGLRATRVWNAATYALVGLIMETIRRQYRPLQISNSRTTLLTVGYGLFCSSNFCSVAVPDGYPTKHRRRTKLKEIKVPAKK